MDSKNEDNPEIVPMPVPESAEEPTMQPGGLIRLLGFFAGIVYCVLVVWLSDQMAFRLNSRGFWDAQMPLGLSIPLVPQFGVGLTAGLLVLALLMVLFRRTQRNLAIGLLPGAGALLLVLISFLISIPPSGFKGSPVSGGPARLPVPPKQRAAMKKYGTLETAARAARNKGNWVAAAAAYQAETQLSFFPFPTTTWVSLGLMLDREGKTQEAYTAYQKGFSPTHNGVGDGNSAGPETDEAISDFGIMSEDRGRHLDACEAYSVAHTLAGNQHTEVLDNNLNVQTTSGSLVQSLLKITLGIALENQGFNSNPAALTAFQSAVKLAPSDPRSWYYLAEGLRRAAQFGEAKAALAKASRLDKDGHFKKQITKSLAKVNQHSDDW